MGIIAYFGTLFIKHMFYGLLDTGSKCHFQKLIAVRCIDFIENEIDF